MSLHTQSLTYAAGEQQMPFVVIRRKLGQRTKVFDLTADEC